MISFAARTPEALLVIDPLLGEAPEPVLELLEREVVSDRMAILISVPYHVRSAERIWERYSDDLEVTIHGHVAVAKRLDSSAEAFSAAAPGERLPGGAVPHAIGKPRRFEMPLELPSHDAVLFGDAVAGVDGRLRVWSERPIDDKVRRFYRERFNPTLEPLVALGAERMLMTHGPSVLEDGSAALARALADEPWFHPPG